MTKLIFITITVITGMLIPVQAGLNAALKKGASNAYFAGSFNAILAAFILLVAMIILRAPVPSVAVLATIPWWAYLGGVCGAAYILVTLVSAPKLGAILLIVCLAAGQMIASVCLDHFGWVGYQVKPITLLKVVGIGLVITGIYLIQR